MKLGADYMWMIEVKAPSGEWHPRPDLSSPTVNAKVAGKLAGKFAAMNAVPVDCVRVEPWKRSRRVK